MVRVAGSCWTPLGSSQAHRVSAMLSSHTYFDARMESCCHKARRHRHYSARTLISPVNDVDVIVQGDRQETGREAESRELGEAPRSTFSRQQERDNNLKNSTTEQRKEKRKGGKDSGYCRDLNGLDQTSRGGCTRSLANQVLRSTPAAKMRGKVHGSTPLPAERLVWARSESILYKYLAGREVFFWTSWDRVDC